MSVRIRPAVVDDPRLLEPQCRGLLPIETVHKNPWFTVRNRGGYYTTEYAQPQVIVLPIVEANSVVMVKVKRPVIADSTMELPAGGVGADETPIEGASRELFEETGIQSAIERFIPLVPIANSPNRNPHLIHIFQINLTLDEYLHRGVHDDEVDAVVMCSFEKISRMIIKGEIYIGVPLAILARCLLERSIGPKGDHVADVYPVWPGTRGEKC